MMGTDPSTWKWTMIAAPGKFAGHSAGPFELNGHVFDEIIANFKSSGLPVPFDLEHASEADATSGSIPTLGAPAQGWIHDLDNRGQAGLWALVEWGEQAKEYIRSGKYAFCSPAVRFGSKDKITGRPVGARLSSVAMTNQPFLSSLDKLAAKDVGVDTIDLKSKSGSLSGLVHSPNDYMPKLRAALKLHELSTADDCASAMDKLRDMCMTAGPMGTHSGVYLGDYTSALSDLVSAAPGTTWEHVFERVDDMIDAAMQTHIIEDHGGQSAHMTTDDGTTVTNTESTTMADEAQTIALKDAQTKAGELTVALKDAETKLTKLGADVSALTLQLKEADAKATKATAELTAATEEIKCLKDEKVKRDEADLNADVEIAYATWKDKKGLSEGDKVHMLSFAKSSRDAFNKMYPPVAPDQRHLLRNAVGPEPRGKPEMSVTALTRRLMTDKHLSYADAYEKATLILSGREPDPYAGK